MSHLRAEQQEYWKCKGCNFLVYGSKDKCIKCNMDRNGDSLDTSDIEDDNLCVICMTQPKNILFLYANSKDALINHVVMHAHMKYL